MFFKKEFEKKGKDMPLLEDKEKHRLQQWPRYSEATTKLLGVNIVVPDAASFLGSVQELLVEEIYKFNTPSLNPVIIDCGANIGLSAIYFKKRFPNARLTCFEPDPALFNAMEKNLAAFGFTDVHCCNEAVSDVEGLLQFHSEGGHSGMLAETGSEGFITVKATRLKSILQQYDCIDFLKIDIEGHETNIIPDIAQELKNVQHLFLEYHSFLEKEQQLGELLSIIKAAGFRYYLKEAYPKPFPFINREMFLGMDCLVNIFCYRS